MPSATLPGAARRMAGGHVVNPLPAVAGSVAAAVGIKDAAPPQSSPGHPLRGRMRLAGWLLTPPYARTQARGFVFRDLVDKHQS